MQNEFNENKNKNRDVFSRNKEHKIFIFSENIQLEPN